VAEASVEVVEEEGLEAVLIDRGDPPSGRVVGVGEPVLGPDGVDLGLGQASGQEGAPFSGELSDEPPLDVEAGVEASNLRLAEGDRRIGQVAERVVGELGDRAFGVGLLGDAVEQVVGPRW
jgi:hypothetical protein